MIQPLKAYNFTSKFWPVDGIARTLYFSPCLLGCNTPESTANELPYQMMFLIEPKRHGCVCFSPRITFGVWISILCRNFALKLVKKPRTS